ncbi:MAG: hypothetical protein H7A39_05275 [Chlamydiales bacterium]|nr:hypothetical protein [Chlamydiales bacterium]
MVKIVSNGLPTEKDVHLSEGQVLTDEVPRDVAIEKVRQILTLNIDHLASPGNQSPRQSLFENGKIYNYIDKNGRSRMTAINPADYPPYIAIAEVAPTEEKTASQPESNGKQEEAHTPVKLLHPKKAQQILRNQAQLMKTHPAMVALAKKSLASRS